MTVKSFRTLGPGANVIKLFLGAMVVSVSAVMLTLAMLRVIILKVVVLRVRLGESTGTIGSGEVSRRKFKNCWAELPTLS